MRNLRRQRSARGPRAVTRATRVVRALGLRASSGDCSGPRSAHSVMRPYRLASASLCANRPTSRLAAQATSGTRDGRCVTAACSSGMTARQLSSSSAYASSSRAAPANSDASSASAAPDAGLEPEGAAESTASQAAINSRATWSCAALRAVAG